MKLIKSYISTGEAYRIIGSKNVIARDISYLCLGSLCMGETTSMYSICCWSANGTMVWAPNVDSDNIFTDADAVGFIGANEAYSIIIGENVVACD